MIFKSSLALFHRVNFFNDIFNRDTGTLSTKVSTALVTRPCRIKRAVVGKDLEGDHFKLLKDTHQDMKDFIVACGGNADLKI